MPKQFKDYDSDIETNWFGRQTLRGLILKGIGLVVVVGVIITVIGFGVGWFNAGKDIISPTNVKNQYEFAYGFNEQLKASATQWCSLTRAENAEANPDLKSQRTSQRLSVEILYTQIQAKYDAQLENAFKAKYVKPADVPTRAPTLTEQTAQVCPGVSPGG